MAGLAFRASLFLGLTSLALHGSAHADYVDRADVQAYIAELVAEHGFPESELENLFSEARRLDKVLSSISRPAERTLEWHQYRRIFIKEPRISQGRAFWAANEETLAAAEAKYGVPPEYVVAILGVETRYGNITGGYRVLDSLTTLAFDYPPRADFFRRELTEYLLLTREENADPRDLTGSYAGAMGYGQFIPSSYRAYAVDFDGDGKRDIWNNEADAIGSVANYFARHGWEPSAPVVVPVEVDGTAADGIANESLTLKRTVGELRQMGVRPGDALAAVPDDASAGLYRMMQESGPEYWLGLNNFHVITRYNRSRLYALAVHQLSQEILAARRPEVAQAP